LVNVLIVTNNNINHPGALGKITMMSIPHCNTPCL
jgi:hypothetical protein